MASRLGATIEQVWKDYAHNPEHRDAVGTARGAVGTILAKTHDAISGITPSVIGLFSRKEAMVTPRDGILSATRASISNTLNAQWFERGPMRALNVVPKALTSVTELFDGPVRDGIHLIGGGGKNDGYVVRYAS